MTLTLVAHLPAVGISGTGHALPARARGDGDPVYADLRTKDRFAALFTGYGSRRVLEPTESLADLMTRACREALENARADGCDVDLLTGFASVSEFLAPNELFAVHRLLGLAREAEVVAIADEFTAFLSSLRLAAGRIWLGQSQAALVVCGCRWSSNVDYRDPVSASIADAAGAALVQPLGVQDGGARLRVLGWHTEVPGGMYGVMRLAPRRGAIPTSSIDSEATTRPLFNMLDESEGVFREWGTNTPPRLAQELVDAAGINPKEVTCIGHQASKYLLDEWRRALSPMCFEDTLQSLGNMTLASIPVTLHLRAPVIQTRFVMLLGLGLGIHASVCLLERW
jgi:3-oxoacyl-[acyl-carrier-protein] synthase III